jgi:hypothetical protein
VWEIKKITTGKFACDCQLIAKVLSVVLGGHLQKDTDAYAQCFKAIFKQVSEDHPTFKLGHYLNGIIADWSEQQANGLEKAVGKVIVVQLFKGCQAC